MNPIHRSAAIALVSGVAVASLAVPSAAAPHTSPTTRQPAAAAAGFLARHLVGRHHDHYVDIVGKSKFADDGETADAVLSMDAAGVAQTAAKRATGWLEKDAGNYLGGAVPDIYPGSAAKLLLVANAQHVNPAKFGSIDLIAALVGTEGSTGAAPGQFQNPGDTMFSSSVVVQSLAVLALAGSAGVDQPDANATTFLSDQACPDGGFQVSIRTAGAACGSEDVDATSYAIQALIASDAKSAVGPAVRWLLKNERADGGWGEQPANRSDANSTAIAVEALVVAHRHAGGGVAWLVKHQEGCRAAPANRGAVRFQGRTFAATTALRATTQAGAALALRPLNWVDRTGAGSAAPVLGCPAHR